LSPISIAKAKLEEPRKDIKLLLATTDESLKAHFQNISHSSSVQIVSASSRAEVLELISNTAILLLDLGLPRVFEIHSTLKKLQIQTPVVAVAYTHERKERAMVLQHGMCDYIFRACTVITFANMLSEILGGSTPAPQPVDPVPESTLKDEEDSSVVWTLEGEEVDGGGLIVKTQTQLAHLQKAFNCFVPLGYQQLIAPKGMDKLQLGDTICKRITILFSDIRNFTAMSEAMDISELMNFLNTYLAFALPPLEKFEGFVDKFIGDSIMCIFTHSDLSTQAYNAIMASICMLNSLDYMNKTGFRNVHTGIGLNTGRTVIGVIGTESRMEPTAIGDSVNLASRTESLCKQ